MSILRRTLALSATAALGALALGAAPAAAVSPPNPGVLTAGFFNVTYTAGSGVANVISTKGSMDNYFYVEDRNAPILIAGDAKDRCVQVTRNAVRCTSVLIATFNLGDGNDRLTTDGATYVAANGGAGNDFLDASGTVERPVWLRGEDGTDGLVGGGGDDVLDTGLGAGQRITGGDGQDSCTGVSTLKVGCEL